MSFFPRRLPVDGEAEGIQDTYRAIPGPEGEEDHTETNKGRITTWLIGLLLGLCSGHMSRERCSIDCSHGALWKMERMRSVFAPWEGF